MRGILTFLTITVLANNSASAEDTYECMGTNPDWTLTLDSVQARFVFPTPTDMDVPLITQADNRDWPRAFTLIGERDTAIVVLDRAECDTSDIRAHVMTQRAELPILLSGCCTVAE